MHPLEEILRLVKEDLGTIQYERKRKMKVSKLIKKVNKEQRPAGWLEGLKDAISKAINW